MMNIWEILGIEETKDKEAIKNAYFEQLEYHHPEEDPDGFMNLRKAYEEALNSVRPDKVLNPFIADWMDRVKEVYKDFPRRVDERVWGRLLEDPVCANLETENEAGGALLEYLMDEYHIPHNVFQMLSNFFGWENREEELKETFPENFIDYVINRAKYEDVIRYSLFDVEAKADFDTYLSEFFAFRQAVNDGEEEDADRCYQTLREIGIDHPDFRIQEIRYYLLIKEDSERAWQLSYRFLDWAEKMEDTKALYWIARAGLFGKKVEEIKRLLGKLMELDKDHPEVVKLLGDAACLEEDYEEGIRFFDKAGELAGESNDELDEARTHAYEALSRQYEAQLDNHPDDGALWKLAETCLKGERYDKTVGVLAQIEDKKARLKEYLTWMAESYHWMKRYEEAIPYRRQLLELKTESERPEVLYSNLGIEYEKLERYEEALECYDKGLEIAPEDTFLHFQKANTLYSAGRYKEAAVISDKGLRIQFNNAQFKLRIKSLYAIREYEELMDLVENLIGQGYDDNTVFYYYAMALMNTKRYEDCREYLEILEERLGQDPLITYEMAKLNFMEKKYEDALRYIDLQLEAEPESEGGLYLKANILRHMERYGEAAVIYEGQVKNGRADAMDYYRLGFLYNNLERMDDAKAAYLKTLELKPDHYAAMNELGDVCQERGEFEEAVLYYKKALDIKEDEPRWNWDLVRCLRRMGRYKEALAYSEEAISKYPDDKRFYRTAALICWDQGEYEAAIPYYEKYGEFEGKKSYAFREIGDCYAAMEQFDKAIECYEKSLEAGPEESAAYQSYGSFYLNKIKDYEKALKYLLKAVSLNQKNSYLFCLLGKTYEKLGREREAKENYETSLRMALKEIDEDGTHPCDYESAAEAYALLKENDKAVEMAEKAIERQCTHFGCPACGCYEAWEDMSFAYENEGDLEKALECMEKALSLKEKKKFREEIERLKGLLQMK